jgi:3-methyladenine DNA glycosylase AlkD
MGSVDREVQAALFSMQDASYADFQSRLMPEIPREKVIGVRMPALRAYSRTLVRDRQVREFMNHLPHTYYEENNVHAVMIEEISDYRKTIEALDAFLPFVDNWATCDMMCPKVLGRHREELLPDIRRWLDAKPVYTVRFGLKCLMTWYLEGTHAPAAIAMTARVKREEYYIRMMVAWFFATALAKQYEMTVPYLEAHQLGDWVHRKAIQKAVESRRLTPAQKEYLKSLR